MLNKTRIRIPRSNSGVALILVMLAILMLTTLAAAMIFSARSETFASYNFRLTSQAEYAARAGLQRAMTYFNSSLYSPLASPASVAASAYNVSIYSSKPVSLFYGTGTPVTCNTSASSPGCSGGPITLGSSSNYPSTSLLVNTSLAASVPSSWSTNLVKQSVSDGLGGTGTFTATATLLDYHIVNNAMYGSSASATCTSGDASAAMGICRTPYEVWQVTSTGTWGPATVQLVATISPMYLTYFGSALYGLCNVTLNGNACTDSYNANSGSYALGTVSPNGCIPYGSTTNNASLTNAGVGSNGGVTISGSGSNTIKVGGNVTFSDSTGNSSCDTGFTGNQSTVAGAVLPGPAVPAPPTINMSTWGYPTTSPWYPPPNPPGADKITCQGYTNVPQSVTNVILGVTPALPNGTTPTWSSVVGSSVLATGTVTTCSCASGSCSGFIEKFNSDTCGSGKTAYACYNNYSCVGLSGSGTASSPYLLGDVTNTTGVVNFVAPAATGSGNAYVVAMDSISMGTGGYLFTSNAVPTVTAAMLTDPTQYCPVPNAPTQSTAPAMAWDVEQTVSLGGTSMLNYNASTPGVPSPDFLVLNIMGTGTAFSMSGQADVAALINCPNGSASLSGSGNSGAFFGSILAQGVTDNGAYAVHYDLSAKSESGALYPPAVVSISRPKY